MQDTAIHYLFKKVSSYGVMKTAIAFCHKPLPTNGYVMKKYLSETRVTSPICSLDKRTVNQLGNSYL